MCQKILIYANKTRVQFEIQYNREFLLCNIATLEKNYILYVEKILYSHFAVGVLGNTLVTYFFALWLQYKSEQLLKPLYRLFQNIMTHHFLLTPIQ